MEVSVKTVDLWTNQKDRVENTIRKGVEFKLLLPMPLSVSQGRRGRR